MSRALRSFIVVLVAAAVTGLPTHTHLAANGKEKGQARPRPGTTSCMHSQGYWKTHASAWPVHAMALGDPAEPRHRYSAAELLDLLERPVHGDASLLLATQTIAAKLNVANGASATYLQQTIARADAALALVRQRLPYRTRVFTPLGSSMVALALVLDAYNTGRLPHTCSPANRPPVADAGPDQTVSVGTVVSLNGSASADPDAQPLTYRWSLVTRPEGSEAQLSDTAAVMPTFRVDQPGTYRIALVVNDGTTDSAPDTVEVSTVNSRPTADAGPDQTVALRSTVQLGGHGSHDPDGQPLTFAWTLVQRPAGSTAALSGAATVVPTFVADAPGEYVASLVVSDGLLESPPDTVRISTTNSPPVARAGPDASVVVGGTVTLDGSGSSDVDGDALAYRWSIVAAPASSQAELVQSETVAPQITIDAAGTYVVQLLVNDGLVDGAPDTVTISTLNSPPVAHAGPDQQPAVGHTVQLDASGSTDVDGNPLTFRWALTTLPAGSAAVLSDAGGVRPTFVVDRAGTYVAQLVVNDGATDSQPDTVLVTTLNRAPVAHAGPGQTVPVGATATLDGTASADPDGDPLTFRWSLTSTPAGSAAALTDPTSPSPAFVADLRGTYVVQVIVNDGVIDSAPATVSISTESSVPVANAGVEQTVATGATVRLDGSASADADGSTLAYFWSFTSRPAGSAAALSDPTLVNPTFVADQAGVYVAQLVVNDGVHTSAPATVAVTAAVGADLELRSPTASGILVPPSASMGLTFDLRHIGGAGAAHVADAQVRLPLPPAYTFHSSETTVFLAGIGELAGTGAGHFDTTTGVWTGLSLNPGGWIQLRVQVLLHATGRGDFTAEAVSSVPDPDPSNNRVALSPIDRRPVANAGADVTGSTRAVVAFDGTASSDADLDALTYDWTLLYRPANSVAPLLGSTTATPSFTPDQPGEYAFQLTVRDARSASQPDTVVATIAVTNRDPAITSTPVTTAAVGQAYRYDVAAADPDAGDTVTFSLPVAPEGMTIVPATGAIAWAPAPTQGGPQAVTVRVVDAGGFAATQSFAIQVSSPENGAPIANDDQFSVRVNESLAIGARGVLANDADEGPLTARLVTPPANGSVHLNPDGSFTYTPHTLQPGEIAIVDGVDLAASMPGVTATGGLCPTCATDANAATSWSMRGVDNLEIRFPSEVTVTGVQVVGDRISPTFAKTTRAAVELLGSDGSVLHATGPVDLRVPPHDATIRLPALPGVRLVRFRPLESTAVTTLHDAKLGELRVVGAGPIRRDRSVEPNLVQLLPVSVGAGSVATFNVAESVVDDTIRTNWYSLSNAPGEFLEVSFPIEVTVTGLQLSNPNGRPDGFATSAGIDCSGTVSLLDAGRNVLFDSGVVNAPFGAVGGQVSLALDVPAIGRVRHVRYQLQACRSAIPLGISELRVLGTAPVNTPAFGLAEKFQTLLGREVHSTPVVINLTDDNGDGRIDPGDIPDILVPVEALTSQTAGEIVAISGADGRELFTAGAPALVSPWAEAAAGDIDGDGLPEIIAVHADGNHLIAFEHTGVQKWISDANAMPRFQGAFVGGAISIANLDAVGPPEIVVGASVFDAAGRLLGDGRTLGGTTGGTGLRSAISSVADIDLDGVPELVAGPSAYRLGSAGLSLVWRRDDRPDGYVGLANFDDDPQAEIVAVANGVVYLLNHDGSDVAGWNAPTHAPVPIPGGGQGGAPLIVDVNADGLAEIGVAAASHFVLFNRDGTVRWKAATMDRSSNSTGAVAFDLDGDGAAEIIYRDELFLRVYRGTDGVLLARTAVESSTWSEEPVVADVDNDGHADLVVTSDRLSPAGVAETGVLVLQDVANRWARTRRIWNQHAYHVTNVNEDGTIPVVAPPHWLTARLNAFRTNAFSGVESSDRTDTFTYVATDGVLQSSPALVRIDVRAPNGAPELTSDPVTTAAPGVAYVYAPRAEDPDGGDVLMFSLPAAPPGMTIDPVTGLVRWTPAAGQIGDRDVILKVEDARGLYVLQAFRIDVAEAVAVPDVVGRPQAAAVEAIEAAGLLLGILGSRHSATTAAGSVISQSPAAGSSAARRSPVGLVVSAGPAPAGAVPDVVGLSQGSAQTEIEAAGFTLGAVTGEHRAAVAPGVVLRQSPAGGTIAAPPAPVALVVSLGPAPGTLDRDGDGASGDAGDCDDTDPSIHPGAADAPGDGIDQNCNGRDSIAGDDTPPLARIDMPADDAVVSVLADIVGTASDTNLLRYTLLRAPVDDGDFVTIGSGTVAVGNGTLGRLDPTLLENGLYRVRLVVEDVNGHRSVAERVYRVTGEAKIGVFRVSFTDLQVPLSGIPITITRSYDSRVTAARDFGVGWTLDVKTGSYRNTRAAGDGWSITEGGGPLALPCRTVTEVRPHLTEVRLSDREAYVFRPRLANVASLGGGCVGSLAFDFASGTYAGASLEVLGSRDFVYTSGDTLTVFDGTEDTGLPFDPSRVRLRTVDGRVVDVDRRDGIVRLEDSNGNSLAIGPGGIVHSSGRSIAFTRDEQGRIVRITDPRGQALTYEYMGGHLTAFEDQAGNRTTFHYEANRLIRIDDPLGRQAVRSEYDDDGRLIAVTDARGARTELTHDIAGRREVLRDALGHPTVLAYDDQGNVLSSERSVTSDGLSMPVRSEYGYDAQGNQTHIVDADGRRQDLSWDAFGNPLGSVLDPAGLRITRTATYDANGRLLRETDPNGDTISFELDTAGNATQWTDTDGRASAVAHDGSGNVTRVVDADGHATQVAYDSGGRVRTRTDSLGVTTSYTYDAAGNRLTESVTRTIDGVERLLTTRFEYDARNRLVRVVDAIGHSTRMSYDAFGRLTARTDPLGRTTTFEYDETGNLTATRHPDGSSELREYDLRGDLLRLTDREGLVTSHAYDELRRRVATTLPGGGIVRTGYSPGGLVLSTIAADGARTDYDYDAAGRRTLMRLPPVVDATTGATVRPEWRYEHDAGGRLVAEIDPRGHRRTVTHDAASRRVTVALPDGTQASEERDQWGRPVRRIDQEGRTIAFAYNGDTGRLAAVTLPPAADDQPAATWQFTYDEAGHRVSQVDPLGRTTRFGYDEAGRLRRMMLPGGQARTLTHDAAGRVSTLTDFDGAVTTFEYDAADRLVGRRYADGTEVVFTYTPGGRRATVQDARGVTRYTHDTAGRLARVEQPGGGAVEYAHDIANRITSITTAGGSTLYGYDALGRVATVNAGAGTTSYGYDVAGNLARLGLPNGILGRLQHNARNQVTSLVYEREGETLDTYSYTYTASGRKASAVETGATTLFSYDAAGRLIGEVRTGSTAADRRYEYDLAGNRTRSVLDGVATSYAYDANDRLLSAGTITFDYDLRGNLVSRNQAGALTTYAWTPDDRLARVTTGVGSVAFTYDADGMRVARADATGTARYLVDGSNPSGLRQVLEERDGAGGLIERRLVGLGLIATERAGVTKFVLPDGSTSTRALSDAAGQVTDRFGYDAFGNLMEEDGARTADDLYIGQQLDRDTGLYYLRERYYDPSVGRFLGRDPVDGDPQRPLSLHRYAYAGNDPVNFADPNGDFFTMLGLSVSQVVSAGLRGIEGGVKGLPLCKVSLFKKAINAAMVVRSVAKSEFGILNVLGGSVSIENAGGASPAVGGNAEVTLFKYEHALRGLPTAPPSMRDDLALFEVKAAVAASRRVEFEFKAQKFDGPPLSVGFTCEIGPPPSVASAQAGTSLERELVAIEPCGIAVGSVLAYANVSVGASGSSLSGSLSFGVKVDAPFLPEVKVELFKFP